MPALTKRVAWLAAATFMFALSGSLPAFDNGPQTLACDYKFGKVEDAGMCLIVGSGLNQGVSWLVFEVNGKRFRYLDSSPDRIETIDKSGKALAKQSVKYSNGQCRPGGIAADIYTFANGDRVCLYWR